jgi:hypothetical protein
MPTHTPLDTTGFSSAGLWVRRQQGLLSLTTEALCLAELTSLWRLHHYMTLGHIHGAHAEISTPDDAPRWVHLLEVRGQRTDKPAPFPTHPLANIAPGTAVRLLAVVEPDGPFVPGALIETPHKTRVIWLRDTARGG